MMRGSVGAGRLGKCRPDGRESVAAEAARQVSP